MENIDDNFDAIFGKILPDNRNEDWIKLENSLNLHAEKVKFEILKKRMPTYLGIAASFVGLILFTVFSNQIKISQLEKELKKQKEEINTFKEATKSNKSITEFSTVEPIKNNSKKTEFKNNNAENSVSENTNNNSLKTNQQTEFSDNTINKENGISKAITYENNLRTTNKKTVNSGTENEHTISKKSKSNSIIGLFRSKKSNQVVVSTEKTVKGKEKQSYIINNFTKDSTSNSSYYVEPLAGEQLQPSNNEQPILGKIDHRFITYSSQLDKLKKIKKNGLLDLKNSRYETKHSKFSLVPSHLSMGISGGKLYPINTNFIETKGSSYGIQLGLGYNNPKNNEFLTFTIGYNFNDSDLISENEKIERIWRKRPRGPLPNHKRFEINNYKNQQFEIGARLNLLNYKGLQPYIGTNWAAQKTTSIEIFNIIQDPIRNKEELRIKDEEVDSNISNLKSYYYGANIGFQYRFLKNLSVLVDYKYQIPISNNELDSKIASLKAGINYHF